MICPLRQGLFLAVHSGLQHPIFQHIPEGLKGEAFGYMLKNGVLQARVDGKEETLSQRADHLLYETKDVQARLNLKTFAVEKITLAPEAADRIELRHAARMCVLWNALRGFYLFRA